MASHDGVLAQHSVRLAALQARFRGHNGVDRPYLLHWLTQFQPEHIPLALKMLEHVTYFTRGNMAALTRDIVQVAIAHMNLTRPERILYVIAAELHEGDAVIARAMTYSDIVPRNQVAPYKDLASIGRGTWDAIVLLKDFSGTGEQLARWWEDILEPVLLPLEAQVAFGVLVLNVSAKDRLAALDLSVLTVRELHCSDNVFDEECVAFSADEKETILRYCERTGALPQYVQGRGQNGLLVAFDHGCPNNSIPVLWCGSSSWSPLFRRHGVTPE